MAANWASGLQVSRWAKELQSEVSKGVYFSKFMGDGPGSAIHVKQMEEGKGKDITFGLVSQLSGSAITGDSSLEGNEQSLSTYSNTVTTNQKRLAVRDTGKFADTKVLYSFRNTALDLLKTQYAELIDGDIFTSLSPTSGTHAYWQADATTSVYASTDPVGTLGVTDLISLEDISAMKTIAQIGGAANYRMRPIRVDGQDYYVLVVHPEVAYSPFTLAGWDGVVIHSHEGVVNGLNGGGAAVPFARNLFMGAQAACFAESSDMMWVEKTFDYGNQLGISAQKIYGSGISSYNNKDYGVIQYVSARLNL